MVTGMKIGSGVPTRSPSPFVGRAEELVTLARVLSRPPAVVVTEGEAGVGKTRLVSELYHHPAVAGRRMLVGWCQRTREPFPLGAVVDAVRGHRAVLAQAPLDPVVGALRPLIPELSAVLPPEPGSLPDRAAERHRLLRALAEVLRALGPAVLVLEDMHWADEQTRELVSYLLRAAPPELALLLTYRGDEAPAAVRALTARLPATTGYARVSLAPMDTAHTGELAAAILGLERVSTDFSTLLRERSAGLPFVIEELLALMLARGAFRRHGGWQPRAIAELEVPAGVRDPVLERFAGLEPDARAVAEAAAVLQVTAPLPTLLATCRHSGPRARAGAERAVESGLLVARGDRVGFRHLLASQAVYEAVPELRRRELHARAAAALARHDPDALGRRAHHLRCAGRLAAWVTVAERAADQAVALGHDDEAARLLDDVLRHAPLEPARYGRLAVTLGRAAVQARQVNADVAQLLEAAPEQHLPRAARGELRLSTALLRERAGRGFAACRPLFAAAEPDLAERPELCAHAMVALGLPAVPDVPLAEHRAWLDRALALLPQVPHAAAATFLLGKIAMVLTSVGDPEWRRITDQVVARTGGRPRERQEVNAYASAGLEACYVGHLTTAERLLHAGLAGAVACESEQLALRVRAALALLDYCRGSWDGLAGTVEVLLEQVVQHANSRADLETVAGCLALARGEREPGSRRLAAVMSELERRGAYDLLPLVASALIRLALHSDDTAGARAQAEHFLTVTAPVPLMASAVRALPALAQALAAAGAPDRATELVADWQGRLRGLDAPLAGAALAHARGAAAGAGAGGVSDLLTAATSYEQQGCPYEAATAYEQAGAALLPAGEHAAGARALQAALGGYRRLQAMGDYDRAARTAYRYGAPVPARHRGGRRGYGSDLSPREREVAQLAADGLTNKQIADELILSVGTVKKQLAAAMRKLGATSRTVIVHRLASPPSSAAPSHSLPIPD